MKRVLITLGLAALAAGTAFADCEHDGVAYTAGAKVCTSDGWLQECTVAGYWRAIGYCRAPDAAEPTNYTPITKAEHEALTGGDAAPAQD